MKYALEDFVGELTTPRFILLAIWGIHSIYESFIVMVYRDTTTVDPNGPMNLANFMIWRMGDLNNAVIACFILDFVLFKITSSKVVSLIVSASFILYVFYYIEVVKSNDVWDYPAAIVGVVLYFVFRLLKK